MNIKERLISMFCQDSLKVLFQDIAAEGFDNYKYKQVHTRLKELDDFEETKKYLEHYVHNIGKSQYTDLFFNQGFTFEFYCYKEEGKDIILGVFAFEYDQEPYERALSKLNEFYNKGELKIIKPK